MQESLKLEASQRVQTKAMQGKLLSAKGTQNSPKEGQSESKTCKEWGHARTQHQRHEACDATKKVLHYTYPNQTWHDLSN